MHTGGEAIDYRRLAHVFRVEINDQHSSVDAKIHIARVGDVLADPLEDRLQRYLITASEGRPSCRPMSQYRKKCDDVRQIARLQYFVERGRVFALTQKLFKGFRFYITLRSTLNDNIRTFAGEILSSNALLVSSGFFLASFCDRSSVLPSIMACISF